MRGIPIGQAWLELAPDRDRVRYSELDKAGGILAAINAANPSSMVELSNALLAASQSGSEKLQLMLALRELLLDRLFNDELHAYGYRVAPSRSGRPIRIAPDLFDDPNLDWEQSRLTARGLEYVDIRILDPQRVPSQLTRRKGRIGSAATIREAIRQIRNSNTDFCSLPRKEACNAIRAKIGETSEIGLGLSNQNISKYILEVCQKRSLDNN